MRAAAAPTTELPSLRMGEPPPRSRCCRLDFGPVLFVFSQLLLVVVLCMRQPFLAACLSGCFGGRCRIMMVSSFHTFTSLETRDRRGVGVPHLSHTCRHDAAAAAKLPLVVRVFFY